MTQLARAVDEPVLHDLPRLRAPKRRRATTAMSTPHRSGRLAAKGAHRAPNPTVQAQNVLMAKWGQPTTTANDNEANF